ncbi:hypothetical protein [uncultured Roseobacter sp.]|uniref:hypothetical protein n=1 Tax=uncultured Roseobacter sp. TaxID=114847 RepID=UPI002608C155|nr:hypothetical protein [uncultured Roseobacter sp.]
MPEHRSDAEKEIRDAVVARLRMARPNARIIHEINLLDGLVRCDVMAVDRSEIVTVEIKSERDKLDRLETQLDAMRRTSHTAIAALHRKFIPQDQIEARATMPRIDFMKYDQIVWWYPGAQDFAEAHHPAFCWKEPPIENGIQNPLPPEAMSLLHAGEMAAMCANLGISTPRKANMKQMERALRWSASGRDICLQICGALRARTRAAEADDPITTLEATE